MNINSDILSNMTKLPLLMFHYSRDFIRQETNFNNNKKISGLDRSDYVCDVQYVVTLSMGQHNDLISSAS
jgi:hypothetical protein